MATRYQIDLYETLCGDLYMSHEDVTGLVDFGFEDFRFLDPGDADKVIDALLMARRESEKN